MAAVVAVPSTSCALYETPAACHSSRSFSTASPGISSLHSLSLLRLRNPRAASQENREQKSTFSCSKDARDNRTVEGPVSQLKESLFRVLASGAIGLSVLSPISTADVLSGSHSAAFAAEGSEVQFNLDRYKGGAVALIAEAPAVAPTPEERSQQLREVLAQKRREADEAAAKREAERQEELAKQAESRAKLEPEQKPKPTVSAPVVSDKAGAPTNSVATKTKKTHGYMPLFLAQFLLVSAAAGIIVALAKVPDSVWTTAQEKINGVVETVGPKVVTAWSTAEPYVNKAWDAAQKLAVESKPYVEKAVAQAQPVVLKAVEAAKPVVKQGQDKVAELLEQAQAKVKSP